MAFGKAEDGRSYITIMGPKVDEVGPKMAALVPNLAPRWLLPFH